MQKYVCVFKDLTGKTFIRCKDGKFYHRPFFGSLGCCVSYHSFNGASRIEKNFMQFREGKFRILLIDEEKMDCSTFWQKTENF